MQEFLTEIFKPNFWIFWWLVLSTVLVFPVRKLIWVLMVRRAQSVAVKKGLNPAQTVDQNEILRLKKRATITAILLCYIFAFFYVSSLFNFAK